MAHSPQEVLDAVAAEDAGVNSIVALVSTLKQQVLDEIAKGATASAALDTVFDAATANAAKIAAAVAAPAVP